jgi:N-acetylmuramoyl-L-alanine amidase
MSIFKRVAQVATFGFGVVAVTAGIPAGTALGAQASPDYVAREPLALPAIEPEPDYPAIDLPEAAPAATGSSLVELVRAHAAVNVSDSELRCLATAVYFEAKSEPLAGQLAVARVVMNRAESGRFASTLCGVVKQPSQFSFVRRGGFPAISNGAQWRNAVGVAQVAMKDLYQSPVRDALYFHAKRVSPAWGKRQVASLGNHIFYR